MSVARTWSVALTGVDGDLVEIEADLSNQTPEFRLIGLADRALKEAVQRVHNACANSELALPRRRITVNLSPANLPKQGSGFDVGIAIAAIATEVEMDAASLANTVHVGELGLDGRLRPVPGILPAVVAAARSGFARVVVPAACRAEAALVDTVEVVGAVNLAQVAALHGAHVVVPDQAEVPLAAPTQAPVDTPDLSDVIGQRDAVDALVVAAAGGHNLLMSGPPGAGKTMLARRLPGILPELDDEAALSAASVRSLSGETVSSLSRIPPFIAPHHSVSVAALVGGGSRVVRPGAVARASSGILFLDEAGEFPSVALDALRQPLESGSIVIDRVGVRAEFPARFQLVLATNPCPCGEYGIRGGACTCPPAAIRRYRTRLSGPLLDRVDIELSLRRVSVAQRTAVEGSTLTSAAARDLVDEARRRARVRLAGTAWTTNAEVPGGWLRDGPFAPPLPVRRTLDQALQRGILTLRGYDRALRVAWTCADIAGRRELTAADIGRALFLKKGLTQ
ncbi:YifB family Mg chelatase-like AAA ATPase [Microbacterium awajiense]|uniref:YifB family Mg chelatase-like AAA ATPase n=1 Tax=Microbacterium awajiense TaxID=415214 RepID=A0ABP7A890_9MICO